MNDEKFVLPEVDIAKCTACGECVKNCPAGAVRLEEGRAIFIASERCNYCGVCEDVCPEGAVTLYYEVSLATP